MSITNVENAEEFQETLKTKLTKFMEENKSFNIQGSWAGEDGITVSVLVDFGIEDRDEGTYYMGSVSARYEDNYEAVLGEEKARELIEQDCDPEREEELMDELQEKLMESDTMIGAENALTRAVRSVFKVHRHELRPDPHASDIDVSASFPIMYGEWDVQDHIESERGATEE